MNTHKTPTVGLIGLGAMGSGMAASLRRAHFDLHVFDVRTEGCLLYTSPSRRDG